MEFSEAMAMAQDKAYESASVAYGQLAEKSGSGYATLARFKEAATLGQMGKTDEAVAIYEILSRDAFDSSLRDLASLMGVYYQLDTAEPQVLSAKLAPLTADDNPWRYSARELAGLLALREGDKAKTKELFEPLSKDSSAPEGVRVRAGEIMAIFGE